MNLSFSAASTRGATPPQRDRRKPRRPAGPGWPIPLAAGMLALLISTQAAAEQDSPPPGPESVVVVANRRVAGSLEVARHYLARRSIPESNLIVLDASDKEMVSWSDFIKEVHSPLLEALSEGGWMDAVPSKLLDRAGRRRIASAPHRIGYLVLCYGMPLKIAPTPRTQHPGFVAEMQKPFRTDQASVDGELALLAVPEMPTYGIVPNPAYQQAEARPLRARPVVRVARLDGPDAEAAKALVDGAFVAERTGLMGRAYIDLGGPHPDGDRWLEAAGKTFGDLGFDLSVHQEKPPMGAAVRFDAPALYFGWYARNVSGPFTLPGFRFPPGAVAVHLHSFSALTMRDPSAEWCGPLVARGAAATVGNVFEPYLNLTHHLDLFAAALARGWTVGDAAYHALPALSWQAVLVGDPLYRPFKVDLETQVEALAGGGGGAYAQYAAIRKMNLLQRAGQAPEAEALGHSASRSAPGMALALHRARAAAAAGERSDAVDALRFTRYVTRFAPDEWLLAAEVADTLYDLKERKAAVAIYEKLLDGDQLPAEIARPLLTAGAKLASGARQRRLARNWTRRLNDLGPAP